MPTPAAHDLDAERVLYLVPYAHLDTQWRWDYRTTIARYLLPTLEKNFYLFERYPRYVFNFTGAIRYQMIQEYYPARFERLRAYVSAGRWAIAGCQFEEADAILPSPESITRQVLYGYTYFQREFGQAPVDYMLPDSFGFPWFLPTVLRHCGLEGFSTQKLYYSSAAGIPFIVGVWEGPDGAELAAVLNAGGYGTRVRRPPERNRRWRKRLAENGAHGLWADYRYYGVGDTGGAPQEGSVRTVEESLQRQQAGGTDGAPFTIHQGASDQLFRDLTAAQKARLPRYSGDLLLTRHSAGMLTSQAAIKRWNRKNELLADAAERLAVVADRLGAPYPRQTINQAWQRLLVSQMHDILPGTSLPACYELTYNDECLAENAFAGVLDDAAATLASCMDADTSAGLPLLVYNPLAFARQDVVEAIVPLSDASAIRVIGPDGEAVPCQILDRDGDRVRLLFLADLPPCGAAIYHLVRAETPPALDTGLRVDATGLENAHYRVTLDDRGRVTQIVDKGENRQVLESPIEYPFLREHPRVYPAWNMEWRDRKRPPLATLGGPAQIEVVESGPVRVCLQITREWGSSRFVQQVRLSCGGAGDRVEFLDRVDWHESGVSFKAAFPLAVSAPEATYNWELGVIRRGNNDPKKFEVPAHQWFDLTAPDGSYGVTVLEDCKYGSDKPADNVLRLTLLFTPKVGLTELVFRDQTSQDWGRHQFAYGLYGHRGSWQEAGSTRQALRFNQPPRAFPLPPPVIARSDSVRCLPAAAIPTDATGSVSSGGRGLLGKRFSFLELDTEQVGLRALKKAEDRESLILRFYELWGRPADEVTLTLHPVLAGEDAIQAWETDGCERRLERPRPGGPAVEGNCVRFAIGAFGIKTIELELGPSATQASAPAYAPLALPYNLRAFTADDERESGALPGGRSFPRELLPDQVNCGGVPLRLALDEELQAVACQGQAIALPDGYDTLLLLASADEDLEATVHLDERPYRLRVQAGKGFIGQGDRRTWNRRMEKQPQYRFWARATGVVPGYLKRDRVGCYTTHMHSAAGNEAYAFGYMFLYRVPLPAGTKVLRLPDDARVRIYAAAVCSA